MTKSKPSMSVMVVLVSSLQLPLSCWLLQTHKENSCKIEGVLVCGDLHLSDVMTHANA